MEPIIDHMQITVKDMDVAVPFYDRFLPLLGFDPRSRNTAVIEDHEFHVERSGSQSSKMDADGTRETVKRVAPLEHGHESSRRMLTGDLDHHVSEIGEILIG